MKSKTLFVFLVLWCVMHYSYGQKESKFFRGDYRFFETTQSFYKFHSLENTWTEAKRLCEFEGATLFYPENEEEANIVISFWNSIRRDDSSRIFLGISDLLVDGIFATLDNTRVFDVYNHWGQGEPNHTGGKEHCVVLNAEGYLNDEYCSKKYPFICKKSLESLQWNQDCNIPYLGYTFLEQFGSCYKFYTKPLTWSEAYTACSAEQSYLAVLDTLEEADYFVGLIEAAPSHRVQGKCTCDSVHLGFHNRFGEGWQTVKGKPLEENSNVTWGHCQPNGGDQAQCGSMFFNGDLNDVSCDTKCFFICEHEVRQRPDIYSVDVRSSFPASE